MGVHNTSAPGNYDFKFSADNWNIQESLDTNLSCVNWVLDSNLSSGIAVNRSVEVINSDIVLDVVYGWMRFIKYSRLY